MLNSRQKKAKREKKAKGNDLQRLVAELQKQETAWKKRKLGSCLLSYSHK